MTMYVKACPVYAAANPIPLTPLPSVDLKALHRAEDAGQVAIPEAQVSIMDVQMPQRELLGYKVFIAHENGYLEEEAQQNSVPYATSAEALEAYERLWEGTGVKCKSRWPGQELLRSIDTVREITAGEEGEQTLTSPDELGAWFDGDAPEME